VARGLELLEEALAQVQRHDERWFEAELYRLKGVLLLTQADTNHVAAAACFQQALVTARRQQSRAWELRAAISLARLWQQQGKQHEAYNLLAPLYGWFNEGFDSRDLQEARALLATLT
jgi:predicted ATPase